MAGTESRIELTMAERGFVEDAVRLRYKERIEQRDRVITELMDSVLVAYPRFKPNTDSASDADAVASFSADSPAWSTVERIVGFADDAVTRYPDDSKAGSRWRVPAPHVLKNRVEDGQDPSAEQEALSNCVAEYMKGGWARSRTLEQWLVRQMIFAETLAFGRVAGRPASLKSIKLWWVWAQAVFKWVVGVLVAVGIGEQHGFAAGVLTYVVWLTAVRFLATGLINRENGIDKLYGAMVNAYNMTMRGVVCPAEVERAVAEAESLGAVWPSGMRSVLERVVARDRAVWD